MSSKHYLTGLKRMKVIQDYINGKEDPCYEVYPSTKEGKYIVRPRKEPLPKQDDKGDAVDNKQVDEAVRANNDVDNIPEEESSVDKSIAKQPVAKQPLARPRNDFDPTVSIEILNQLKSLGDELRAERQAKQQKKLIKATVKEQMYKHSNQQTINNDDDGDEPVPQPIAQQEPPRPIIYRRRVNLLQK